MNTTVDSDSQLNRTRSNMVLLSLLTNLNQPQPNLKTQIQTHRACRSCFRNPLHYYSPKGESWGSLHFDSNLIALIQKAALLGEPRRSAALTILRSVHFILPWWIQKTIEDEDPRAVQTILMMRQGWIPAPTRPGQLPSFFI